MHNTRAPKPAPTAQPSGTHAVGDAGLPSDKPVVYGRGTRRDQIPAGDEALRLNRGDKHEQLSVRLSLGYLRYSGSGRVLYYGRLLDRAIPNVDVLVGLARNAADV